MTGSAGRASSSAAGPRPHTVARVLAAMALATGVVRPRTGVRGRGQGPKSRDLRTLCANAPFRVVRVDDYLLLETSTGNPRRVPSSSLDRAWRVLKETGGTTGNIGHAVVDPASPERCGLGCRGCLETKSTAPALEREANRVARENPGTVLGRVLAGSAAERVSVSDVKAAADAGDDTARGLLAEAGRWLGIGLATFAATFSPDVIVLGGGMAEMGPALVGAAIEAFEDTGMPYVKRGLRVVPAALGNDAAMIGAVRGLSR